ncbi:hypothetical protein [Microbacterium neungamense]|uniref:hypothetical protein n=1 Tax=Microbacterium neungamense TaxID=2810535 RepID=UPI00217E0741|nr:hypothetical protein [Microbacterium neungamense]UWF77581.1 hypothetical protein JSY13_00330 [Microbacterium neungamense]
MVDRQRSRYVGGSEGAPPPPPPGGYRGARRTAVTAGLPAGAPAAPATLTHTEPAFAEKRPANVLGLVAISVVVLFTLTLLLLMLAGGTDALYGVTMITLQLVVVGVVIAALATARGRMLGAIALAVTLLFNVATVGAMGALRAAAVHDYDGTKTEEQKHEQAYPGIRGTSSRDILDQRSLEQVQSDGDALMAEIRDRLTAEYGFSWVESGARDISPERNGYGGESMLKRYTSTVWTTAEPVRDNERKRAVMRTIDEVLRAHGMYDLYALNEPGSGISDDMVAKLYGSADPEQQHTWEWYSDAYPDPMLLYVTVYDLSKDRTGDLLAERRSYHEENGEPLEGVQLVIHARQLLGEGDRAEFEERLKEYPGF